MKRRLNIVIMTLFAVFYCSLHLQAQEKQSINGYLVPMCIYNGDTIPCVQLRTVYIFRPLKFKNEKERREYYKLVRNVKKVYPISKEINQAILKEISPGISLEGMMLELKLQYFGHLMRRVDSFWKRL